MALSWRSLQQLLDIVARHSVDINMELNTRKSVCMVFNPRNRSRVLLASFPQFSVNGVLLSFVSSFPRILELKVKSSIMVLWIWRKLLIGCQEK